MLRLKKLERTLGIAQGKRRYDLPLNKDKGGNFIKILMGLMTFLAVLALSASFALSEIQSRWSSGLENRATVEISAEDNNGGIISRDNLNKMADQAYDYLRTHPAIETAERMDKADIIALVSPWLGNDIAYEQIPLPEIITISFKPDIVFDIETVTNGLQLVVPHARIDTHESWLKDILRFAGALKFAAIIISIIIAVTTIIGVAGAVQSRMEIYHEELELLHLMGAADGYISSQLQRYILLLCLQGAVIGALFGGLSLTIIGFITGKMDINLLPSFSFSGLQIMVLLALPILIALLGMVAARQTVLRVLQQMP